MFDEIVEIKKKIFYRKKYIYMYIKMNGSQMELNIYPSLDL